MGNMILEPGGTPDDGAMPRWRRGCSGRALWTPRPDVDDLHDRYGSEARYAIEAKATLSTCGGATGERSVDPDTREKALLSVSLKAEPGEHEVHAWHLSG